MRNLTNTKKFMGTISMRTKDVLNARKTKPSEFDEWATRVTVDILNEAIPVVNDFLNIPVELRTVPVLVYEYSQMTFDKMLSGKRITAVKCGEFFMGIDGSKVVRIFTKEIGHISFKMKYRYISILVEHLAHEYTHYTQYLKDGEKLYNMGQVEEKLFAVSNMKEYKMLDIEKEAFASGKKFRKENKELIMSLYNKYKDR